MARRRIAPDLAARTAAATEDAHQRWHDYVQYLDTHRALLDLHTQEEDRDDDPYEDQDHRTTQEAALHATLSRISTARRALFDRVRHERRHAALASAEAAAQQDGRRSAVDPIEIDRLVLQQLRDAAHGNGTATGEGEVPIDARDDGTISWWAINVGELRAAPSAAAYRLQATDGDDQRRAFVLAGGVVLSAIVVLLVYFLWPAPPTTVVIGDVPPQVGSERVDPWPLTRIEFQSISGTLSLPISTTVQRTWPADNPGGQAFWQRTPLVPLRLCAPQRTMQHAQTATVLSSPTQPERVYVLSDAASPQADLLLVACDDPTIQRTGVLSTTSSGTEAVLGQAITHQAATITVTRVFATGPATDPALPADQHAVLVAVQTTAAIDWPTWNPTLLTVDGTPRLAGIPTATTSDTLTFRILVPTITTATPAIVQLTPPGAARAVRWRVTLTPPLTRSAYLRTVLAVGTPEITGTADAALQIAVTLHNTGATPLALAADDITVVDAAGERRPLPPDGDASPLAPDETRTLTLTLPRPTAGEETTLGIGPYRYSLQP